MTKKETLKRALKELLEARHNLRNGQKNRVPPDQMAALWEKVEYREMVVEELRHPSHIDREAWEPCKACSDEYSQKISSYLERFHGCATSTVRVVNTDFCPRCGRPLTEEGWAMLEKRLRG